MNVNLYEAILTGLVGPGKQTCDLAVAHATAPDRAIPDWLYSAFREASTLQTTAPLTLEDIDDLRDTAQANLGITVEHPYGLNVQSLLALAATCEPGRQVLSAQIAPHHVVAVVGLEEWHGQAALRIFDTTDARSLHGANHELPTSLVDPASLLLAARDSETGEHHVTILKNLS